MPVELPFHSKGGQDGVSISTSPEQKALGRAVDDLLDGARRWRIWSVLAMFDIRARYRRSKLGQFWITISMAVMICALGIVYSAIFRVPLDSYLPLVAVSFIVWGLIASLINDGSTVFIDSETYLRSSPLPKSMFIFRMLARVALMFAHNLILVPIVLLIFLITPTWASLLFVPAFLLTILNGLWVSLVLGTLCARFRDLPPIVASVVQIAFFVSPVMWGRPQLGPENHVLVDWNPIAVFLELMREPLLGRAPDLRWWAAGIGITVLGFMIALPFFARFRSRIAYYI
jgi:ABC-type polysaccharide/polyol phosphate export permease